LEFRYQWTFASAEIVRGGCKPQGKSVHESKHLSADREWEGHDEEHEECHLCYQQEEHLYANVLAVFFLTLSVSQRKEWSVRNAASPDIGLSTYKTVVESHVDGLIRYALWEVSNRIVSYSKWSVDAGQATFFESCVQAKQLQFFLSLNLGKRNLQEVQKL
jgi:hypothetical protein